MYREIKKKKVILENRKPFNRNLAIEMRELSLIDMIFTTMRLGNGCLDRKEIKTILDGNVIKEATIEEHSIIENYKALQYEIDNQLEMGSSLSLRTIVKLYEVLHGKCKGYRTNNPILRDYSYNPPHFKEVDEQMEIVLAWISKDNPGETSNELLKAAFFHNRFIEIYPFDEGNEEMARICLWYYMMSKGYPIFSMNFSLEEYNAALTQYFRNEEISGFYGGLERSLYNKLDYLLNITSIDD